MQTRYFEELSSWLHSYAFGSCTLYYEQHDQTPASSLSCHLRFEVPRKTTLFLQHQQPTQMQHYIKPRHNFHEPKFK